MLCSHLLREEWGIVLNMIFHLEVKRKLLPACVNCTDPTFSSPIPIRITQIMIAHDEIV